MSLVVDSSATLAWVFADETTPPVRAVFDRVVDDGAIVPSLWRLEVANSLTVAVRRGRIDAEFRREALAAAHCGCFPCLTVSPGDAVHDRTDGGQTRALSPLRNRLSVAGRLGRGNPPLPASLPLRAHRAVGRTGTGYCGWCSELLMTASGIPVTDSRPVGSLAVRSQHNQPRMGADTRR